MPPLATTYDPDLVRWGLHLLNPDSFFPSHNDNSNAPVVSESPEESFSHGEASEPLISPTPIEVYNNVADDEAIAQILQEELSKLEAEDAQSADSSSKVAVLSQDWPSNGLPDSVNESSDNLASNGRNIERLSPGETAGDQLDALATNFQSGVAIESQNMSPPKHGSSSSSRENSSYPAAPTQQGLSSGGAATPGLIDYATPGLIDYDSYQSGEDEENLNRALALSRESEYNDEVARRLTQLDSIKHVPRINSDTLPTTDDASMDHARLAERLILYGLTERQIQGDGNCQFRALSDQIYRSSEHHAIIRKGVVTQLKAQPDVYSGYVPMAYSDYLKKMAKNGEWGDHVTLQAAADHYGVKIWLITSFKDTSFIEILPQKLLSSRVIHLSFWAEVHYNSIYPDGEMSTSIKLPPKRKPHWLFKSIF